MNMIRKDFANQLLLPSIFGGGLLKQNENILSSEPQ